MSQIGSVPFDRRPERNDHKRNHDTHIYWKTGSLLLRQWESSSSDIMYTNSLKSAKKARISHMFVDYYRRYCEYWSTIGTLCRNDSIHQ